MIKITYLYSLLVGLLVSGILAQEEDCIDVDPMPGYTMNLFEGVWYDVARIQTPKGAAWVSECYCDFINSTLIDETNGDTDVGIGCNLLSADGNPFLITGLLRDMQLPGEWDSYTIKGLDSPPITWTNIYFTEDYAISYDCGTDETSTEYCVHFMSRTRTIEPSILEEMVEYAESLGLNPRGIDVAFAKQDGCT